MKSSNSFKDRGTDRPVDGIDFGIGTLKDLSNYIRYAFQSWKLVGDEENNIPPSLH